MKAKRIEGVIDAVIDAVNDAVNNAVKMRLVKELPGSSRFPNLEAKGKGFAIL